MQHVQDQARIRNGDGTNPPFPIFDAVLVFQIERRTVLYVSQKCVCETVSRICHYTSENVEVITFTFSAPAFFHTENQRFAAIHLETRIHNYAYRYIL